MIDGILVQPRAQEDRHVVGRQVDVGVALQAALILPAGVGEPVLLGDRSPASARQPSGSPAAAGLPGRRDVPERAGRRATAAPRGSPAGPPTGPCPSTARRRGRRCQAAANSTPRSEPAHVAREGNEGAIGPVAHERHGAQGDGALDRGLRSLRYASASAASRAPSAGSIWARISANRWTASQ